MLLKISMLPLLIINQIKEAFFHWIMPIFLLLQTEIMMAES